MPSFSLYIHSNCGANVHKNYGSVAPLKSLYFHWTAICSSSIVFTPRSLFLLFVLLFSGRIVEDLTTAAKIRQSNEVKGVQLYGNEIKLCQFADDTSLFCADLMSVENCPRIIKEFGEISGLKLNIEKTKAMWLGKWSKEKRKPLNLKWVNCPTKILGIHFSYDEKANNELNFNLKLQRFTIESRHLVLKGPYAIW